MGIVEHFVNPLQARVKRQLVSAPVHTQKMGDISRLFLYPDEIKDVKCQVDTPTSPLRLGYFACSLKWFLTFWRRIFFSNFSTPCI